MRQNDIVFLMKTGTVTLIVMCGAKLVVRKTVRDLMQVVCWIVMVVD